MRKASILPKFLRSYSQQSCVVPSNAVGFTLIELIIGTVILTFLFAALIRIFSFGVRGTQKGIEAADHLRSASSVFLALEADFRNLLPVQPFSLTIPAPGIPTMGGVALNLTSGPAIACKFWKIQPDKKTDSFVMVTYEFDPRAGIVLRRENVLQSDGTLRLSRSFRLGGQCLKEFTIKRLPPTLSGHSWQVQILSKSKHHSSFYTRVFSSYLARTATETASWWFKKI